MIVTVIIIVISFSCVLSRPIMRTRSKQIGLQRKDIKSPFKFVSFPTRNITQKISKLLKASVDGTVENSQANYAFNHSKHI